MKNTVNFKIKTLKDKAKKMLAEYDCYLSAHNSMNELINTGFTKVDTWEYQNEHNNDCWVKEITVVCYELGIDIDFHEREGDNIFFNDKFLCLSQSIRNKLIFDYQHIIYRAKKIYNYFDNDYLTALHSYADCEREFSIERSRVVLK